MSAFCVDLTNNGSLRDNGTPVNQCTGHVLIEAGDFNSFVTTTNNQLSNLQAQIDGIEIEPGSTGAIWEIPDQVTLNTAFNQLFFSIMLTYLVAYFLGNLVYYFDD